MLNWDEMLNASSCAHERPPREREDKLYLPCSGSDLEELPHEWRTLLAARVAERMLLAFEGCLPSTDAVREPIRKAYEQALGDLSRPIPASWTARRAGDPLGLIREAHNAAILTAFAGRGLRPGGSCDAPSGVSTTTASRWDCKPSFARSC